LTIRESGAVLSDTEAVGASAGRVGPSALIVHERTETIETETKNTMKTPRNQR
jgi:hypothetical protein